MLTHLHSYISEPLARSAQYFKATSLAAAVSLIMTGCGGDDYICTFPDDSQADCAVKPLYLSWSEISDDKPIYLSANNATPQTQRLIDQGYPVKEFDGFLNAGKIYTFGDILLVNDRYSGVYLFDNTNPETPKFILFFSASGSTDMVVNNGFVYINNFTNLLAFELADPSNWNRTIDVLDYRVDENLLPNNVRFAEVEFSISEEKRTEVPIDISYAQGIVIGYINSNGTEFLFSDSEL